MNDVFALMYFGTVFALIVLLLVLTAIEIVDTIMFRRFVKAQKMNGGEMEHSNDDAGFAGV